MPADDPLILVNDICEVTYKGTLCGQTILTVMHYRFDSGLLQGLTDAMDDLSSWLQDLTHQVPQYLATACSNYRMDQLVLQIIKSVRYARFAYTIDSPGLQATEALTADLAAYIEFSTPFATARKLKNQRGFTGGIHFAPVPSEFEVNGLLTDGYRTGALDDLGAKLIDTIETTAGNVWVPVLYHKSGDPPPYTDISRYNVKKEVRVMRRRTVGRGI